MLVAAAVTGCTYTAITRTLDCTIASVATGATASIPVSVAVDPSATNPGTVNVTASVAALTAESDVTDNGPVTVPISVTRTCQHYTPIGGTFACGTGATLKATDSTTVDAGHCCVSTLATAQPVQSLLVACMLLLCDAPGWRVPSSMHRAWCTCLSVIVARLTHAAAMAAAPPDN